MEDTVHWLHWLHLWVQPGCCDDASLLVHLVHQSYDWVQVEVRQDYGWVEVHPVPLERKVHQGYGWVQVKVEVHQGYGLLQVKVEVRQGYGWVQVKIEVHLGKCHARLTVLPAVSLLAGELGGTDH